MAAFGGGLGSLAEQSYQRPITMYMLRGVGIFRGCQNIIFYFTRMGFIDFA